MLVLSHLMGLQPNSEHSILFKKLFCTFCVLACVCFIGISGGK